MYRIEFMGVPGAGKSTIRNQLVRNLQKINKNKYLTSEEAFLSVAKEKIDRIYRPILKILPSYFARKIIVRINNRSVFQSGAQNEFLARHGESLQLILASREFQNMSHAEREIAISGFLSIGALYQCISEYQAEAANVFYDEGFVQKIMMFVSPLTFQVEMGSTFNYLDHVPLPNLIVYVKADLSKCIERMIARPRGLTKLLQIYDNKVIYNYLEKSEQNLEQTASWLTVKKNITLITINNDNAPENAIEQLTGKILHLCQ